MAAEEDPRVHRKWDPLLAAGLLAAAGLTRWPFRSPILDSWDACQFALALEHYNIPLHRPHPPGYPLFVGPAFALYQALGDANLALTLSATLWGLGACWAASALACELYGRRAGVLALLLLATSPMLWALSEVALSYTAEACCSAVVGLLCYRAWRGERRALVWAALALGLAGGVRQNVFLFCCPLFIMAVWPYRITTMLAALFGAGAVFAAVMVPAVLSTGNAADYFVASQAQMYYVVWWPSALRLALTGEWLAAARQCWHNATIMLTALVGEVLVLGAGAVPMAFARGVARPGHPSRRQLALWFALWTLPALAFECLFIIGHTGYALFLAPPLTVLAAGGLGWLSDRWRLGLTLAAAAVLANVGVFLALMPSDVARWHALQAKLDYVTQQFDPAETVLVTARDARHAQYYLREYQGYQLPGWWTQGVDAYWALRDPHGFRYGAEQFDQMLVPPSQTTLPAVPDPRTTAGRGQPTTLALPATTKYVVFLDERYLTLQDANLRVLRTSAGEAVAVADVRRVGRYLTYDRMQAAFSHDAPSGFQATTAQPSVATPPRAPEGPP